MKIGLKGLIFGSILNSLIVGQGMAADFSSADALFSQRADATKAEQARAAYNEQIAGASTDEKIYGVEQMARIDYLLGSVLPETSEGNNSRKVIFKRCLDSQELINPANFEVKTPVYYYWKGVCLASWAKANGILKSLEKAGELVESVEAGKTLNATYEGGGFFRLGSAIYLNLPGLFGGSIDKALEYSALAESSEAYEGAINPDTETGRYFYNLYLYKSQILVKQNQVGKAKEILVEALARIDAGDVSGSRVPETALHRKEIAEYLATL